MPRLKTGAKRVNFYLTEIQQKELRKLAKRSGLTFSEHLRRAVDEYLSRQGKK